MLYPTHSDVNRRGRASIAKAVWGQMAGKLVCHSLVSAIAAIVAIGMGLLAARAAAAGGPRADQTPLGSSHNNFL